MKTWVKIVIGTAVAVVVLIAATLIILRWTVDPDAYRSRIDAAVSDAIGRDIDISGPAAIVVTALAVGAFRHRDSSQRRWIRRSAARPHPFRAYHAAAVAAVHRPAATRDARYPRARSGAGSPCQRPYQLAGRRAPAVGRSARGAAACGGTASARTVLICRCLRSRSARSRSPAPHVSYDDDAHDRHYRFEDAGLETGRISNGHPFRLEAGGDLSWPGVEADRRGPHCLAHRAECGGSVLPFFRAQREHAGERPGRARWRAGGQSRRVGRSRSRSRPLRPR